MESRIPMMEKENSELRVEKDRLSREIELLTQRLNSIQRLHTQQVSYAPSYVLPFERSTLHENNVLSKGVKSNVNITQEKSNTEPPTANIKPMAGPSSSVTKSQQVSGAFSASYWGKSNCLN